jgi:predicted  nucleic acid-binding Zn-ribbon protein
VTPSVASALLLLLLQGQASSKAVECDLLRKKLSAAESSTSALRGDLAERDAEMDALRQAVKDAEAAASDEQEKAAEEVGRHPFSV